MPSSRPAGVGTRTTISGHSHTPQARCAGSPRASTVITPSPSPREGGRWRPCATRYGSVCGWPLTATAHALDRLRAPADWRGRRHRLDANGRIVYGAHSQNGDIWIANADGSQQRQPTSQPGPDASPQARSDDSGIVYSSRAPSGMANGEVWRMDLNGENPRQIDTGGGIYRGFLQAIGDHVYFRALEKGGPVPYRVPLSGGPRTRCSPTRHVYLRVSTYAASLPTSGGPSARYVAPPGAGIAVVPLDGVGPVRTFPHSHPPQVGMGCTWAPDGRAFEDLVVRDGVSNLWRFPLDGSAPRAVTTFTSEQIICLPMVTGREDAGDVARDVFGRCGVDRERRQEGRQKGVAVRLILTSALLSALAGRGPWRGPGAARRNRGHGSGRAGRGDPGRHGRRAEPRRRARRSRRSPTPAARFAFPRSPRATTTSRPRCLVSRRSSSSAWRCSSGRSSGCRSCSRLRRSPRRSRSRHPRRWWTRARARAVFSLRQDTIDLLPKGRDFTSLVSQAPGANQEPKLGGISIDGVERLGESLHRQRHRDDEPAQRRVGPRGPAGVRRRAPGEVERLHRRVRRLDRRRDQRRDQERHQRLARRRAGQPRRRRARGRAAARRSAGCPRTRHAPST